MLGDCISIKVNFTHIFVLNSSIDYMLVDAIAITIYSANVFVDNPTIYDVLSDLSVPEVMMLIVALSMLVLFDSLSGSLPGSSA